MFSRNDEETHHNRPHKSLPPSNEITKLQGKHALALLLLFSKLLTAPTHAGKPPPLQPARGTPEESECPDVAGPEECARLVAAGGCFVDVDTAWSLCPASCGVCPEPAPPSVHQDLDYDCVSRAAKGECAVDDPAKRAAIRARCSRSCQDHPWRGCANTGLQLMQTFAKQHVTGSR